MVWATATATASPIVIKFPLPSFDLSSTTTSETHPSLSHTAGTPLLLTLTLVLSSLSVATGDRPARHLRLHLRLQDLLGKNMPLGLILGLGRAMRRKKTSSLDILSSKRGPRDYYKGKNCKPTGFHTRKGGYVVEKEKLPNYVVPDLTDFKLGHCVVGPNPASETLHPNSTVTHNRKL
ncbi:unnamed protein product [Camellia sinensis]